MKSWLKKKTKDDAPAPQQAGTAMHPQAGQMIMPTAVSGQYGQMPPQQMAAPHHPQQGMPMRAPQPMQAPRPMGAPQPMQAPRPMGAPQPAMPAQGMPPQGMPPQGMPPQGMPGHAMGGMPRPQMQAAHAPQAPHMSMPTPQDSDPKSGERALPAITIHAFCDRQETASVVSTATQDWRMKRTNLKVFMGGLLAATAHYQNENTPSLVMIESGLRGQELFTQLEALAAVCDAGTKVVVIGAVNDIRLYRDLIDKGVSDYLVPPFHPLTLIRSLAELYVDPDKPFIGKTCAFFGAKGGVGSSTLAHNMAHIMANLQNLETALIDLDASWGTTGLDFNYDSVQGLEEALASPDRLDETLIDRIMIRHSPTLSILPAAASLNNVGMGNAEAYEAVVDSIRKISPFAILDLPHQWTDWTTNVLKSADEIVITALPDLACLRNTKNLIEYLRAERPNDPDPVVVLNKTGVPKTPEISVKDFASALNIEPTLVLPYEPILYAQAANDGKMLSETKGDGKTTEGISFLAHRVRQGGTNAATMKTGGLKGGKGGSLIGKLLSKKK